MVISQLTVLLCQDIYRHDWETVQVVHTKGWNMVSFPLYFNYGKGIHKDSLFRNSGSSLFKYNGRYVPCDTLYPEVGYWIKLAKAETVHIIACPAWPIGTVPVRAGWNMIGSTKNKVLVDTIIPGKGYWVKAKSVGIIKLQYVPGGVPEPQLWPIYFDYPSWHPAGQWIAAQHADSVDENGDGKYDIIFGGVWLVHAENGVKKPLVRYARHPEWSPDGTHLAFYDRRDFQIYTVRILCLDPPIVDTSSLRRLTYWGMNLYPAWSPDGKSIAFFVSMEGIWLIRLDGSYPVKLISGGQPNWSNDSKYIEPK